MPFPKGKANPGAGRPKGAKNKNESPLAIKARELGVDPFEILLLFAKGDYEGLGYKSESRVVGYTKAGEEILEEYCTPTLRQKSARDAAEYLYPKLKSVELTDPEGKNPFKTFAEFMSGALQSGNDGSDNS
jgi:hypothetical protein